MKGKGRANARLPDCCRPIGSWDQTPLAAVCSGGGLDEREAGQREEEVKARRKLGSGDKLKASFLLLVQGKQARSKLTQ